MLKRIEVSQLRVGMFIEAIEGGWLNSPISQRRFKLERETDLESLNMSNLSGIFINTTMGVDVLLSAAASNQRLFSDLVSPVTEKALVIPSHLVNANNSTVQTVKCATMLLNEVFAAAHAGGVIPIETVSLIIADISKSMAHSPSIFIKVTRLKSFDETTFLHSISVAALMIGFAHHLKLDHQTVQTLGIGGLLHDIGKLRIPTKVLNKTGALTDGEMELMRRHPRLGYGMISPQRDLPDIVLDVCLHHHERPDGKGYPEGLKGQQISQHARMAAICDVYDAVTSARPYKKPWPPTEAAKWMLDREGYFDRPLLHEFLEGMLKIGVA